MSGIFKSPNQCDLPGDNLIKFLVSVFFFIDDQIQCYCYVICHTVNVHFRANQSLLFLLNAAYLAEN
jgi:hypothetical protein